MTFEKFQALAHIWRDERLSRGLRTRLYNVRICSVLLYSCEAWTLTSKISRKLRGFHARCMSRIYSCHEAVVLRDGYGGGITQKAKTRSWMWLDNILRMDQQRLVRKVFDATTKLHPPYAEGTLKCCRS